MGPSRLITALAVPLIFFFAGCVDSSAGTQTPAGPGTRGPVVPAAVDEENGGIEGVVTDEEQVPIAGALLGLTEAPQFQTQTDDFGRYALSHVPPGRYKLQAARLGYESVGRFVEVQARAVTEANVVLPVLPIEEPWPEKIIDPGIIRNGVGLIRTATCTNCGNTEETRYVFPKGLPADFSGVMIEVTWQSRDYLGIDFLDRTKGHMYWRTRSQSPVHFLVERCGDYVGAPHFGRQTVPCTEDEVKGNTISLEDWYVGEFQEQTHLADPVCQTATGPIPPYQAGCYGVGFIPELRFTNYITVFHGPLPPNAKDMSFRPDG